MKYIRNITLALYLCGACITPVKAEESESRWHRIFKAGTLGCAGLATVAACTALYSALHIDSLKQQETPTDEGWLKAYWQCPEANQKDLHQKLQQNAQLKTKALSWDTFGIIAEYIAAGSCLLGALSYLCQKATA